MLPIFRHCQIIPAKAFDIHVDLSLHIGLCLLIIYTIVYTPFHSLTEYVVGVINKKEEQA